MALTIRLTEQESDFLSEISNFLDEKTASGTIRKMISLFMAMQRKNDSLDLELYELKNTHNRLVKDLLQIRCANERIDNYLLNDRISMTPSLQAERKAKSAERVSEIQ